MSMSGALGDHTTSERDTHDRVETTMRGERPQAPAVREQG
jgi:hypothetical protein